MNTSITKTGLTKEEVKQSLTYKQNLFVGLLSLILIIAFVALTFLYPFFFLRPFPTWWWAGIAALDLPMCYWAYAGIVCLVRNGLYMRGRDKMQVYGVNLSKVDLLSQGRRISIIINAGERKDFELDYTFYTKSTKLDLFEAQNDMMIEVAIAPKGDRALLISFEK